MRLMLQTVSTLIKFSVPRVFPVLTKEHLLLEVQGEKGVEIDKDLCAFLMKEAKRDTSAFFKELTRKSKSKLEITFLYHRKFNFGQEVNNNPKNVGSQASDESSGLEEAKTENAKKSSLLDHFTGLKDNIQKLVDEGIDMIRSKPDPEMEKELSEVIIHVHGGGFVSMSPDSHQNYTRRWANSTRRPVFSIDYRLAPENPFPAALDDCWQFYNWLLLYGEIILGNTC